MLTRQQVAEAQERAAALIDRAGIVITPAERAAIEVADLGLEELERMLGDGELVTVRGAFEAEQALDRLGDLPGVRVVGSEAGQLVLAVSDGGRTAVDLLSRVLGSDLPVDGVSIQPPGLTSLFLKFTGRELRD